MAGPACVRHMLEMGASLQSSLWSLASLPALFPVQFRDNDNSSLPHMELWKEKGVFLSDLWRSSQNLPALPF